MLVTKGVGRKIFEGRGGRQRKRPKIALLRLFQGGGKPTDKKTKNSTINLYLVYLYHV